MKKLIWITIIGVICLAGCTLSGLDLKLKDPSITSPAPTEVPIK